MRLRDSTQCKTDSSWILIDSSISKYTLYIYIYTVIIVQSKPEQTHQWREIANQGASHLKLVAFGCFHMLLPYQTCHSIGRLDEISQRALLLLTRTILQQQQQQQIYLDRAPTNGEYPVRARAQNRIWSLAKPPRIGQNYSFV